MFSTLYISSSFPGFLHTLHDRGITMRSFTNHARVACMCTVFDPVAATVSGIADTKI
jgi:hypothetical protein